MILAVLCGLAIGGRAAFFALPGFKPVAAMVILSGVAFGRRGGLLGGSCHHAGIQHALQPGALDSLADVCHGASGARRQDLLYRKGLLRRGRLSLSVFGAAVTLLLYGGIVDPASVLMYQPNPSWPMIWTAFLTGLPADLVHAAATFFFLWFLSQHHARKAGPGEGEIRPSGMTNTRLSSKFVLRQPRDLMAYGRRIRYHHSAQPSLQLRQLLLRR